MLKMITDWLMVIITFVYVVATVFICVYNAKSAKTAWEQTEQMKLQFLQSNRPVITVEIVYLKRRYWVLRFTNRGAITAFNVSIDLDRDFIDSLPEEKFRHIVSAEVRKIRTIGVNQHYDMFFGGKNFRTSNNGTPIKGKIHYYGTIEALFVEDFCIEISDYAIFYSVDGELEDIKRAVEEQTKEIAKLSAAVYTIKRPFANAEESPSRVENFNIEDAYREE